MRNILFAYLALFLFISLFSSCYKDPGCICRDGHLSHSSGQGTCSWHGGIDHYVDTSELDIWNTIKLSSVLGFIAYVLIGITIGDIRDKRKKRRLSENKKPIQNKSWYIKF